MLTENTKNAFLCIESVDETRNEELVRALKDLEISVQSQLGGSCKSYILDINNRSVTIY